MVVPSILGIGLILLGAALGIVRLTDERPRISDMGQTQKSAVAIVKSGSSPEADSTRPTRHVLKVPLTEVGQLIRLHDRHARVALVGW